MNRTVKIKLVKKQNAWNGFQRYSGTKDPITPYYDSTGLIYTGLNAENQEKFEKLLKVDLSPQSDYWKDYKVNMIGTKEKTLELINPENELAYIFLLNHKRIAKSLTDSDIGLKDYYIVDEDAEADLANTKAGIKIKANQLFSKLSNDNKKDILKLYPGFVNTNNVSSKIVDAKLYEELEKDASKFILHAEDKNRDVKILLKDLVKANILRKNKSSYYYGDDFLGHDEESAISYIEDPIRQSLKIDLMAQINKK
jgi:hypothetical protein